MFSWAFISAIVTRLDQNFNLFVMGHSSSLYILNSQYYLDIVLSSYSYLSKPWNTLHQVLCEVPHSLTDLLSQVH